MRNTIALVVCSIAALLARGAAVDDSGMGLPEKPPGSFWPLGVDAHESAPSFSRGDPVVGTTYFYWYDVETNSHIIDHDGTDALTTHPDDMSGLSYKRVSWHETQLRDMTSAGIDFLMPVYWGVPGDYDGARRGWSFVGLPPLAAAHDRLCEAGETPPAIGMFFDTSILRANAFRPDGTNYHVDLTTDFGKAWFYTVIRDFFSLIPPSKWARVDGKPIVFLYAAAFAEAQDPALFAYLRRRFEEEFSTDLFLVKMRDWQGPADATYQWTGASGLQIDPDVIAISPGYDHSAVPGRAPLLVERRDGRTYTERWFQALRLNRERRPWMVHVETWNEWHEGTDVAHSREYGRMYVALTRVFADLWRNGTVELRGAYTDAQGVSWEPGKPDGLAICEPGGDGYWKEAAFDEVTAAVSAANDVPGDTRFLYFDIDESFAFDLDGDTVTVSVTYWDTGCDSFDVAYDNIDPTQGLVDGAFRPGGDVRLTGTEAWKTASLDLAGCRFINRCNRGDFRFGVLGGNRELAVSKVTVTKR